MATGSASSGPVPAWSVTRVEDTTIQQGARGITRAKRVWYQLLDGDVSFVELPLADFNPDHVKRAIEEQAGRELEVKALVSDTTVDLDAG